MQCNSNMAGALSFNKDHPVGPVYFFYDKEPVHSVAFVEDGENEYLFCGTENGTASAWNLKTLRLAEIEPLPVGPSQCIFISYFSDKLITQDKAGLVKCWVKCDSWEERMNVQLDYAGFCKLSICTEQEIIACPFSDSVIHIYNLELNYISKFQPEKKLGHVMSSKQIKWNDKYFLLVAYENSDLLLWSYETNQKVSELNLPKLTPFTLDFDNNSGKGICGTNSKKLPVFTVDESCCLSCIHTIKIKNSGVSSVKIHPHKEIVAVGCWDTAIRIFSWLTYELLTLLTFHSMAIEDMCFSPRKCHVLDCECVLAVASRDRRISLWNVNDLCSPK